MSVSTDAILFFGYCWDEENFPFEDVDEEDETGEEPDMTLARHQGFDLVPPDHENYKSDDWGNYFAAKRKFLQEMPVIVVCHCHNDCPMYGIALRESVTKAHRGDPKRLFFPTPNAVHVFGPILEKLGVEQPGIASWWLVSYADY